MSVLLDIRGISKTFARHGQSSVQALDDVHLRVEQGTIAGLVGESGSGKSTLIRTIMGLSKPDSGSIEYGGRDLLNADRAQRKAFLREAQLVFQDPYSSLDPRMTVEQIIGEGLAIQLKLSRAQRRDVVIEKLALVGLDESARARYPQSFSGGQRQRIAIARALAVDPKLLICDEPVSALDVSVQAQIINLLIDMQRRLDLTVLFVAHDLAVIHHLCDTVTVLQHGRVVEQGPRAQIFESPRDEYTRELLDAIPVPDPTQRRGHSTEG